MGPEAPQPRPIGEISPAPILFEVAWEVCNQIGGIYTVIRTKVPAMMERWGTSYCLIGPYEVSNAAIEFEPAPPEGPFRPVLEKLESLGIPFHFGRWLVNGRPQVLLIDYRQRIHQIEQIKYYYWKDHYIALPGGDPEIDATVTFGHILADVLSAVPEAVGDRPVIAHFHEWMAATAIPKLRQRQSSVRIVFTTHATLLGRYLASDRPNFYEQLDLLDPPSEADHYNIRARYDIERAAAHGAHVFSTISDVTAHEARALLGRNPECILPNGLNIQRFTALHEFQNLHLKFKERIHEFTMAHFFPSYSFDLDRTLYMFVSGRYEYRNKGMDIFIEALHRLNHKLREVPDPPTIVAFIVTRAATKSLNVAALQSHLMFDDLKAICKDVEVGLGQRLMDAVVRGRFPAYDEFVSRESQIRLKRAMHSLKSSSLPLIVTHDMRDDSTDPVLCHIRHRNLFNAPSDPVKVVFHPEFITTTSPLFNMDYSEFVRGCHIGVFPSYYEPWGYTPLECIALGIPAVTTDLSGFGTFVERHLPSPHEHGIYLIGRRGRTPDWTIHQLTEQLLSFCALSRRERIELRNRAERTASDFDWSLLARHYHAAHDRVLG